MKKIFQLTTLLAMVLVVFSCAKTEVSTDQYDSAVVALKAYGPRPVVRGGILRFVGSNLDKVVTVTIPGVDPITPEVVTSGVHSEIRVTVPKDGPEVGYPVLTLSDGSTITAKTQLTYSEPIVFESFSPAEVLPGATITIKGDYLNLIHEVILPGEVYIPDDLFVAHDRYTIKVTVPETARTGKIGLGTLDESEVEDDKVLATLNVVESEEDLVVLTAEGALTAKSYKAGDAVTIKGTNLTLTKKVELEGADVTEFVATATTLTFVLPDTATDGEVLMVMASEVAVSAGEITTVVPVVSGVTPAPVKNGAVVTLAGSDLDLVTKLDFPNAAGVEFTFAEGLITATVPEIAKEGDITLSLANGKTVTADLTLVKPTITAFAPAEITAGDNFTVTGTDLDLVKSVAIGDVACEFTLDSETQITATSAATAQTGKINLTLKNGTKVSSEDKISVKAAGVVQVTELPASASVGDEVTMKGSGFNFIEAIYFGETKITAYSKRVDDEMVFTLPVSMETGSYTPKFVLTTGEEEVCALSIEVKGAITTIVLFEGSKDVGQEWDGGKALVLDKSLFAKVPYGASIHFEYECTPADYNMFQFCYNEAAGWAKFLEVSISGTTSYVMTPTREELNKFYETGLVVFGYAWVLSKVYVTYENTSSDPIFVSDIVLLDWDNHGDHNGGWDMPWDDNAAGGELRDKAEGDQYMYYGNDLTEWKWLAACNHYDKYTVNPPALGETDMTKYNIKLDVLIVDGETALNPADCAFKVVVGDKFASDSGVCSGVIPATTNGKWITLTFDPAECGLPESINTSNGSNGLYGTVFKGLCFDNYRLSLK